MTSWYAAVTQYSSALSRTAPRLSETNGRVASSGTSAQACIQTSTLACILGAGSSRISFRLIPRSQTSSRNPTPVRLELRQDLVDRTVLKRCRAVLTTLQASTAAGSPCQTERTLPACHRRQIRGWRPVHRAAPSSSPFQLVIATRDPAVTRLPKRQAHPILDAQASVSMLSIHRLVGCQRKLHPPVVVTRVRDVWSRPRRCR